MTGPMWWLLGVLCAAVGAAVGDLCSDEIRGRLDRVPMWLARQACRTLPSPLREDRLEEWTAELAAILDQRGADKLPITRLIVSLRFAAGLFAAAPRIAGRHRRTTPRRVGHRLVRVVVALFAVAAAVSWLGNLILLGLFAWLAWPGKSRRGLLTRHDPLILLPMAAVELASLVRIVSSVPMPLVVTVATTTALLIQPWLAVVHTARFGPVPAWLRATAVIVPVTLIPWQAMVPRPLPAVAVVVLLLAIAVPTLVTGARLLTMGRQCLAAGAAVVLLALAVLALGLPLMLESPALVTIPRLLSVLAAVMLLKSARAPEPGPVRQISWWRRHMVRTVR